MSPIEDNAYDMLHTRLIELSLGPWVSVGLHMIRTFTAAAVSHQYHDELGLPVIRILSLCFKAIYGTERLLLPENQPYEKAG